MVLLLARLAQALPDDFPSGPDDLEQQLTLFFLLFAVGFLLATFGHLFKSRTMVGVGVAMIFLSTAVFMVAIADRG
jgi:drug/metabolite transporter (DMT)-like permease